MVRNKTIKLEQGEKERLDQAAAELYGTESVPYGETVSLLIDRATEDVE